MNYSEYTELNQLWIFEAPEIVEDKEVEIASALGIGLLTLVLDKRSERELHEKIHRQHDIIEKMNDDS